ncbi:MAG TPA: DUF5722 domain-containing protein [Nocardioides sp.]|nr:DUF5722 domain-containing protein [Nocardioides sp.]
MPRRALGLVLFAVVAALLVPGTSGAAPTAEVAPAITSVTVTETGVAVTGTATAGESVEVRALGAETTADPEAPLATATGSASDGTFRVELPRRADDGTDLLYAQYVAVTGAGTVGRPHFADHVQVPARRTFPYPEEASKKGLQVQLTDDAEELGVQSAAINVSLGELMLTGPDSGRPTIAFPSGGRDFYFDQAVASRLDRQIKPISDTGAVVDLIILVYRSANPHSAARILMDPAASPTAGTVMGFNTTTREGVAHLTAAMEFLAERYTRDDQRYGRAVGFIMGNEVDAQWEWSNSGEKTLEEFLDGYSRALRIGWLATRSAYADARTYVSLTHSWTRPSGANPDEQRRTRFYAGRDVLDWLQELSDTQGSFPWHVAFHPYPQDLFDPTVWDDPDAVDSPDAPVVTFRNLDVLTTYLSRPALAHDGQRRRVILSEQGCNTPGGDVDMAERLQAACYAYAYYRSRFLPGIDSFILHRHVDHRLEGGLMLGLWAGDPESSHPAAPLRHKLVYDVFRDIDTPRSLAATEFALDVIGIDSWAEVIPGFDPAVLGQRPGVEVAGSRTATYAGNGRELGAGWEAEHNVAAMERVRGGVRFATPGDVFGSQWRGVGQTLRRPVPVGGTRWLTAHLKVPDTFPGEEVVARIRATSATGRVAEADARLAADGRWRTIAADLRGWAPSSRLREVQVWVRGTGSRQAATEASLGRVALVRRTSESRASNLLASATMTADAGLSATLTLRLRSLDADPLQGRATLVACGGHAVERLRIELEGLSLGETRTVTAPVDLAAGSGADRVCIDHAGTRIVVPVAAPDVVLDDLEADADGWSPGVNVAGVQRVTSIANAPGTPFRGYGALEATGTAADPNVLRSARLDFPEALDLSAMGEVVAQMNAYGGAVGATGYTARIVVTSADGTSVSADLSSFTPDRWNRVSVGLAGWPGRAAVTSITFGMAARGSSLPAWAPRFQVDDVVARLSP